MELQNLPEGAAVLGEGHGAQAGEGIGGGPWDPVQDWGGRLVRSSQRPQVPGRAGGRRSHPGCGQLWASRVREWEHTHPEGWAHRQRLPHASWAPCGRRLERQQGPPASPRRTASWAHAVVSATTLNDNCCVLDTHTLTHLPPTPTHSLAQIFMKCGPKHTPVDIPHYSLTQGSTLRCSAQI